jgi:hypothetical protein
MKNLITGALACFLAVGCESSSGESELQGSRARPVKNQSQIL